MVCVQLSYHSCVRVIKETLALREVEDLTLIHAQHVFANPEFSSVPNLCVNYNTPEQLRFKLKQFHDIDIIHVHNEPDWMVYLAKDVFPDVPVIFDVHDLASLQDACNNKDDRLIEERMAIEAADAYIFVSEGYERKTRERYKIPESKPSKVIYSYCNREMLLLPPWPRIRGIAYEGGLSGLIYTPYGMIGDPAQRHRNHTALADFLAVHNIPFAVYGADNSTMKQYLDRGAMAYPTYPYMSMLQQLSRYDWCFVGSIEPTMTLEDSMPNKLFESITAGVPVIVCNQPEAGKWVEDNGFGVQIRTIYEIPEIYSRHEELRKNVQDKRGTYVMENQIPDILALYEQVKK